MLACDSRLKSVATKSHEKLLGSKAGEHHGAELCTKCGPEATKSRTVFSATFLNLP